MAGFSELCATWETRAGKPVRYRLREDLVYTRPSGEEITVPAGFDWDGDSVPRIPLAYWLLKGRAQASATLHDWLYASQAGKEHADDLFLEAMAVEGLPKWQRYPIYWGVQAFGGPAYRKHGERLA